MRIERGTILIDLTRPEEELWKDVHKANRWSVNKARKEDVRVRRGLDKDKKACHSMYVTMCAQNQLDAEPPAKLFAVGELHVAEYKGAVIAFSIVRTDGKKAILRHNASSHEHKDVQANSLLYWQTLLAYKKRGFSTFDLGGIDLYASHLRGLDRFKRRWGGDLIRQSWHVSLPEYLWWRWLRKIPLLRTLKHRARRKQTGIKKTLNIALLTKNFHAGEKDASITTVLALAKELRAFGHNVHIITHRGSFRSEGEVARHENSRLERELRNRRKELIEGVTIHRPKKGLTLGTSRLLAIPRGLRAVEKHEGLRFDIIHNFAGAYPFVLTGWLAKKLSKGKRVRLVHSIKSYSLYNKHWWSVGSETWIRLLNLADVVTVPSKRMLDKLVRKGLKKGKVKVIRSPISLDRFKPQNRTALKKKYGYEGKTLLLYYGQWGKQKGVHKLIEAAPQLARRAKDLHIILAHPSWILDNDRAFYESRKEDGNIELIEGREKKVKIEDYVAMADLVILPYTSMKGTETNPLCVIESIACKTPIVTSDFDELKELLGDNAYYARPGDVAHLSSTILAALKDKKRRERKAEHAYPNRKQFDIKTITKEFSELYQTLLSQS